jgi:hypothetical protein
MWQKRPKKTVFTLNTDPDGYKEITDLTFPLLKAYCKKIGADFHVISDRKFPEWKSVTYEKCQVYQLAQDMENDWNIFIDADAVVHPDMIDLTSLLPRDTVLHNDIDFAGIRWKPDRFFLRDGRNISSCTWFNIASDWCIEMFKPLDDLTQEEAYSNIFPIVGELKNGYEPWRLIEDYVFSRNIAKYGLKFTTFSDMTKDNPKMRGDYFWHMYAMPIEEKVVRMKKLLRSWSLS